MQDSYVLKYGLKLDSKKINITVAEGVIKMDSATQNQYYDSFAKIQVLATSFRCKVSKR